MIYSTAVCVAWGVFFLFWILSALRNRQSVRHREPFSSRFVNIFLYSITAALLIYDWRIAAPLSSRFIPDHWMISLAGLAAQAAGLWFALRAQSHLGSNWSAQVTLATNHQLIQSGPYRLVRHPMYFGILAGMFGTVVVIGELRGFLAAAAVLAALLWKIRVEEDMLSRHFGEGYQNYRKGVKSILPFLY
ncbi:MAG: isoprenylcysteine carboxylmethyltransferase family protein [Anaerolineales bacterium]|nr:isoprenylcysteine carboxylmethyltransferase family protein [Anaerolineales bacterium]